LRGILIIAAVLAAAALWWLAGRPAEQPAQPARAADAPVRPGTAAPGRPDVVDETGPALPADDMATCLTPEQLENHPALRAESERLLPVLVYGPEIDAYRGLPLVQVELFADQGDSAAMTVAGAIHVRSYKDTHN